MGMRGRADITNSRRALRVLACLVLLSSRGIGAPRADTAGYALVSHRARIEISPETSTLGVTDTLLVRLDRRDLHSIRLDIPPQFTVSVSRINGKEARVRKEGSSIELEEFPADSEIEIVTEYGGPVGTSREASAISPERAVLRDREVLLAGPGLLRFTRLTLVIPRGWRSTAVGRCILHDTAGAQTTDVWEFDGALKTIGWICAGTYAHREASDSTTLLSVDWFPEDSIDTRSLFDLMARVLRYYERRFVPYRFSKLAIVEVDDQIGGKNILAIAGPSFILVKRLAFQTDDRFNRVETILPHEIAHQWWAHTVFVGDEDAAFLAEGFCEYSDRLYHEAEGGLTGRDSLDRHPLLPALLTRAAKGDDLPLEGKADLRSVPTQYLKAAYVHHMLRRLIGDSKFMSSYREFALRFAGKEAIVDDFRETCERVSGQKLGWFFDQWVKHTGILRLRLYNVHCTKSGDFWLTTGRIRLVGLQQFTGLVTVGVETPKGREDTHIRIGSGADGVFRNDVPFRIVLPVKPTRAILDPDGDLLSLRKLPVRFSALREPDSGIMIVGTRSGSSRLLELARSDSAEMDRAGWSLELKPDTAVTLGDLQRPRVFVYGKASENVVAGQLEQKFLLAFRGDSAVVEGSAVFDSTLTLMQAIENPYLSDGVICWIAPLSSSARPALLPYDDSWVLTRGRETIASGVWEIRDDDRRVDIP